MSKPRTRRRLMHCVVCSRPFQSVRNDAMTCSIRCRKTWSRARIRFRQLVSVGDQVTNGQQTATPAS